MLSPCLFQVLANIGHRNPGECKLLAFINLFQYGTATKFQSFLIIYLALQHCLQNPNAKFQHWDMSYQMTCYILAYMLYFCRPGHIWCWMSSYRLLRSKTYWGFEIWLAFKVCTVCQPLTDLTSLLSLRYFNFHWDTLII